MATSPVTSSQQGNSSQGKLLVIPLKTISYLYAIVLSNCFARKALLHPLFLGGGGGELVNTCLLSKTQPPPRSLSHLQTASQQNYFLLYLFPKNSFSEPMMLDDIYMTFVPQ